MRVPGCLWTAFWDLFEVFWELLGDIWRKNVLSFLSVLGEFFCYLWDNCLPDCCGISVRLQLSLLRYCCVITAVPIDLLVLLWDCCAVVKVLLLDYCVAVVLSYCRGRDLDAARSAAREI